MQIQRSDSFVAEFRVAPRAAWTDPETAKFRDLLRRMSDYEFEALEAELEHYAATGEKSRCIRWLEDYFNRDEDVALAA